MKRALLIRALRAAVALADANVTRKQATVARCLARYGRGSHWMSRSWTALRTAEANRDVLRGALDRLTGGAR